MSTITTSIQASLVPRSALDKADSSTSRVESSGPFSSPLLGGIAPRDRLPPAGQLAQNMVAHYTIDVSKNLNRVAPEKEVAVRVVLSDSESRILQTQNMHGLVIQGASEGGVVVMRGTAGDIEKVLKELRLISPPHLEKPLNIKVILQSPDLHLVSDVLIRSDGNHQSKASNQTLDLSVSSVTQSQGSSFYTQNDREQTINLIVTELEPIETFGHFEDSFRVSSVIPNVNSNLFATPTPLAPTRDDLLISNGTATSSPPPVIIPPIPGDDGSTPPAVILDFTLPAPVTLNENTPTPLTGVSLNVANGNGGDIEVIIQISNMTLGSLLTSTSSGASGSPPVSSSFNAMTGEWRAFGQISEVNELLSNLQFTPALDQNGVASFSFLVNAAGLSHTETLGLTVLNVNIPPTVAVAIADQSASEDSAFSYTVPLASFTDVDAGDTLTYSATLSNGSPLPSWLNFNPATRTFSGTPLNADVGSLTVRVTASDGNGGSVFDDFVLATANTNDAPTVAVAIADQSATQYSAFSYTVSSTAFADVDVGDTLTYTATLSNGSPLPSWLSFNPATRTFSGTPLNADVGSLTVRVTASDGNGGSVFDEFVLATANTNDAPTVAVAIADQGATEDSAFSYTVPLASFADVDVGDTLTYSATLSNGSPLPSWLSFNPATRTFSGTPLNGDVGSLTVRVTASDGNGGSVFDDFVLATANTNDAPTVAVAIADQGATEDSAFSYTVPLASFADVDVGDTLTYSATLSNGSPLPSWLSFNPATRTFSGTPLNGDVGSLTVRVTASDGNGGSVFDDFVLATANTNDAPTVAVAIADQGATEDSAFSYTVPLASFADVDVGDTLTYSATLSNGSPLPSWLSFNAATRTFSGTPLNADVGSLTVRVTASDGNGGSVFDDFVLATANTNDAPTVAVAIADQGATEDSAFSYTVPLASFADVDVGDTLTYSATLSNGSPLPSWLSFNAATRTFSGTPLNADVGSLTVRVTASDGNGGSVFDDFVLATANTNDAPTVAVAIADQNATQYSAFSYTVSSTAFADVDVGDTLTYSAILSNGTPLPSWLSFNAGTRTFSGTPNLGNAGTLAVRVTASDGSGGSVFDDFDLVVTGVNLPPVNTLPAAPTLNEDTSYVIGGVSVSDLDSSNVTVTLSVSHGVITINNAVSGGLTAGGITGNGTASVVLSGTTTAINATLAYVSGLTYSPVANFSGTDSLTITTSDGLASDTDVLTLNVSPLNDAPLLGNVSSTVTFLENSVNAAPQIIDGSVTLSDVDDGSVFDVGSVRLSYSSSGAQDQLGIAQRGNGAGQIGVSGIVVSYGGVAIGTISSNGADGADLEVVFNSNASTAAINALIERFTYQNTSNIPVASRDVIITVADQTGGLTSAQTVTINVTGEADHFILTAGNDVFLAGPEDDLFSGSGTHLSELGDQLSGGAGMDELRINSNLGDIDTSLFAALEGIETFNFNSDAAHNLIIDTNYHSTTGFSGTLLTAATSATSVGVNFDASAVTDATKQVMFTGGGGDDTLLGGSGNDTLDGGSGDDSISAGAGTDLFNANSLQLDANDTLSGGNGIDTLRLSGGGANIDTSLYTNLSGIEVFELNANNNLSLTVDDAYFASAGFSGTLLTATSLATAQAFTYNGTAITNASYNASVTGGGGSDTLRGGAGADTIIGGAGNDSISGGGGADLLTGGLGADIYVYNVASQSTTAAQDTISDFVAGTDRLDFTGMGLEYIHNNAFGGAPNQIRWQISGSDVLVQIDTDGNAVADSQIVLTGVASLSLADFLGVSAVAGTYTLTSGNDNPPSTAGTELYLSTDVNFTASDTVSGGGGSDILQITSGAKTFSTATFTNLTGVETFQLNSNGAHNVTIGNAYYGTAGFVGSTVNVTTTATTAGIVVNASGVSTATRNVNVIGGGGADALTGGAGNDTLIGGAGNDTLVGNAGNDSVNGGDGNDTYSTTLANLDVNDSLSGGAGNDTLAITSGAAANFTVGTTFANITGFETLSFNYVGAHNISVNQSYYTTPGFSGTRLDLTTNSTSNVRFDASAITSSSLYVVTTTGNGNDTILGGAGNDIILSSGSGNDSINAGAGNDNIRFTTANLNSSDTIIGGLGIDTLQISGSSFNINPDTLNITGVESFYLNVSTTHNITLDDDYFALGLNTTYVTISTATNSNVLTINGSAIANSANALSVTTSSGNDVILGGAGNDTLNSSTGNDSINAGAGNDRIEISAGSSYTSADTILGGAGTDSISLTGGTSAFTFNSATHNISGVEQFILNRAAAHSFTVADAYFASAGFTGSVLTVTTNSTSSVGFNASAVTNSAYRVSFTSSANGGNDTLIGGAGNDTISSTGTGSDSLDGGSGNDLIIMSGGNLTSADTVLGGAGQDTLQVTSTTNYNSTTYTNFQGIENFALNSNSSHVVTFSDALFATAGFVGNTITLTTTSTTAINVNGSAIASSANALSLTGFSASDTLTGGAGADSLTGGGGNDTLNGGAGNDVIDGGTGNDSLIGGIGVDTLTGGTGTDNFAYTSLTHSGLGIGNRDIITDFTQGSDKLDFGGFAGTFLFRAGGGGISNFTGSAAQLAWEINGGSTIVFVDTNGDNVNDFQVELNGNYTLTATDFVL